MNEEIRLFRKNHGDIAILSCLIEGTPKDSFPPALIEDGREPLAANLTPKNFRLGTTQIAATLMGVGLDDLIQRELKRIKRRVMAITAVSTVALLIMGSLTWTAFDARQLAQKRTHDAEGQIEYMLTDLKDKLEEVGSLDILNDVGERASDYYDSYPLSDHDDDALGRRARVFHHLGEIQDKLGNLVEADKYFLQAYEATQNLLSRDPTNADRVFEHAQSTFWVAYRQHRRKNHVAAEPYFQTYLDMAKRLETLEGPSNRAQTELSYAFTNMGLVSLKLGDPRQANHYYALAADYKQRLYSSDLQNRKRLISLANAYAHLAGLSLSQGDIQSAQTHWQDADMVAETFLESAPQDASIEYRRLAYQQALSRLSLLAGRYDGALDYLSTGESLSAKLLTRDPSNVDVRHEDIRLKVIKYEIALHNNDLTQAKNIQSEIERDIKLFPDEFKQSAKYKALSTTAQNLPLYLALRSKNKPRLEHFAVQQKQLLISLNIETGENVIAQPYTLSSLILINIVLEDAYSTQILQDLCRRSDLKLDHLHRALLSARFEHSGCTNALSEGSQLNTIVHQAVSYFEDI